MQWMTVKEYAAMVGMTTKSVYANCNKGRIAGARKVGNCWRIALTDEAELATRGADAAREDLEAACDAAKGLVRELRVALAELRDATIRLGRDGPDGL